MSTGALNVSGPAKFLDGLEVTSLGNASTSLTIISDTLFFGRPYFTSDTGGTAVIKKGSRAVEIVFDREYIEAPIMNASIAFGTSTSDETIEALLQTNLHFAITKRTVAGFVILLNRNAEEDISFNWIAFAVKDSKEFTSRTVKSQETAPSPLLEIPLTADETSSVGTSTLETSTSTATLPEPENGNTTESIVEDPSAAEAVSETSTPPDLDITHSP